MYEKAMPIAMEASGGSLALFMVSTISPVGVALVIRSAIQMKKINLMALAKPLEMVATVTGHLFPGKR